MNGFNLVKISFNFADIDEMKFCNVTRINLVNLIFTYL